jgi:CxxC motif-containing protein (DUF1111 family)
MTWRLLLCWLWYRWCTHPGVAPPFSRASGWEPVAATTGLQNYFVEDDPTLPPPGAAMRQLLRLARRLAPQEGKKTSSVTSATADSIPDEIYTLW